jgi:rhamnogalacturonyl hydrolase YesR
MNKTYIDTCVREALQQAKGNKQEATRLLLARQLEDKLLEDGLFANFREAATHYHVQRVAHGLEERLAPRKDAKMDDKAFDALVENLQKNLGGNPLAAGALKQAEQTPMNRGTPANHQAAVKTLAAAFGKPKKKPSTP